MSCGISRSRAEKKIMKIPKKKKDKCWEKPLLQEFHLMRVNVEGYKKASRFEIETVFAESCICIYGMLKLFGT